MKNKWSDKLASKGWQLYGETKYAASFLGVSLVLMLAISPLAHAKIYRVVDDNGNVSYTDTPPKSDPATVEEVDIPKVTNSYDSQSIRERQRGLIEGWNARDEYNEGLQKEKDAVTNDLAEKLRRAELALKEAKTIKDGDMWRLKTGGTRKSPEYIKRVEQAEANVEALKAELNQ